MIADRSLDCNRGKKFLLKPNG